MIEKWKGVIYSKIDYSEWLEVSNLGRFKNPKTGTIRKQNLNKSGYWFVTFSLGSRDKKKTIKCHKAIAIAWIPNDKNKPFVNHIDGNKANNNIDNLEWVTAYENTAHAISLGLMNNDNIIKEMKEKYNNKVIAKDKTSNEELFFESQDDAIIFLKKNNKTSASNRVVRMCINRACNKKRKSYLGFYWHWFDENLDNKERDEV